MKKYLVLSFLFLLAITPAFAKNSSDNSTVNPVKQLTLTPQPTTATSTGNQVKNQNEKQTQNQGEEQQLKIETKESEQLNQDVNNNLIKVSDQVHQLIETVGAKGGIGQQVKEIAQNQTKLQDEIKNTFNQLNSRSALSKFFFGSDKKNIQTMTQQIEQNRLLIQQIEDLKLQTKNSEELKQLQETINLMISQNTSLQGKIDQENKSKGIFNWFINLFNIQ